MTNIGEKIIHNWTEYQLGKNSVDITSLSEKCNPSAWDYLIVSDSEDGWANKKVSYWNIAIWAMEVNAYGTWADWSPTIQWDNVFLEAKEWNFENLIIPAWTTLRFCWDWVPVLKVRNCFCNMGTISTYGPYITKDAYAYYMIGWTLKTIKNTPSSTVVTPISDIACAWWCAVRAWNNHWWGNGWAAWENWWDWYSYCWSSCYSYSCWWPGWAWTECAWWGWGWGWATDEYKSWCLSNWCPWWAATWMNGWAWGKWGNGQKGWAWDWWGGWFWYCNGWAWWEGWYEYHYWHWGNGWNGWDWYLGNGWAWWIWWNSACYFTNCYWSWGNWGKGWDSFYGNGWRGWDSWCPGWCGWDGWNSVCWCWWDGWNAYWFHYHYWDKWGNWWYWYLKWGNGWSIKGWDTLQWWDWWNSYMGNGGNWWNPWNANSCRACSCCRSWNWGSSVFWNWGNWWCWALWAWSWNIFYRWPNWWLPGNSVYWTWGRGWDWVACSRPSYPADWGRWRNWWNWGNGAYWRDIDSRVSSTNWWKGWDAWWGMYWLWIFVWGSWYNNCIDAHWGNGWNGWCVNDACVSGWIWWNATNGWVVHILYWGTFTEWCVDVSWGKGWCGWSNGSVRAANGCDWLPWDKFISKVYF